MNNFKPNQEFPTAMFDGVLTTMGDFLMKPGPDECVECLDGDPFHCRLDNMRLVNFVLFRWH
jgi:hypothetical protein